VRAHFARTSTARGEQTLPLWIGAGVIAIAVGVIYSNAARSYFLEDDFHWLAQSFAFEPANLLRLERYGGFYRPVIEVYFYSGLRLFGCEALPFHVLSITIHLLCTLVLFLFARALTGDQPFALLSALLFSVQSSYVEAVSWVAAITELLSALWYLLALWMHLRFLQEGRLANYIGALVPFVACLLTHESAATLLPMMIALEMTLSARGNLRQRAAAVISNGARYVPFGFFLIGFLVVAYVVNSRHYVVREGYYAFGSHAVTNVLDSIVGIYVGEREVPSYIAISVIAALLLWRGGPRVRFLVVWIFVTLLPFAFFTWGTASRYLYLPAAGFAMLLAVMILHVRTITEKWLSPRAGAVVAGVLALAIGLRFIVFARKGTDDFRKRTLPYEQFVAAVNASGSTVAADRTVGVAATDAQGVAPLYRDPAAQVGLCTANVRVTLH
jgi:hypothetical protein